MSSTKPGTDPAYRAAASSGEPLPAAAALPPPLNGIPVGGKMSPRSEGSTSSPKSRERGSTSGSRISSGSAQQAMSNKEKGLKDPVPPKMLQRRAKSLRAILSRTGIDPGRDKEREKDPYTAQTSSSFLSLSTDHSSLPTNCRETLRSHQDPNRRDDELDSLLGIEGGSSEDDGVSESLVMSWSGFEERYSSPSFQNDPIVQRDFSFPPDDVAILSQLRPRRSTVPDLPVWPMMNIPLPSS